MIELRFVETPDGPAAQILSGGTAAAAAMQLTKHFALRPDGVPPDPILTPIRRLFIAVEQERERREAAGEPIARVGFEHETDAEPTMDDLWVTTEVAANALGLTVQATTKRCRLGRIPGAKQEHGRWVIPRSALPREDYPDDAVA